MAIGFLYMQVQLQIFRNLILKWKISSKLSTYVNLFMLCVIGVMVVKQASVPKFQLFEIP